MKFEKNSIELRSEKRERASEKEREREREREREERMKLCALFSSLRFHSLPSSLAFERWNASAFAILLCYFAIRSA